MMKKLILLLCCALFLSRMPAFAQPESATAEDYQFSYSLIASSGPAMALSEAILGGVLQNPRLAEARLYALWSPVEKPAAAPFAGLDQDQVILMLAWPAPATPRVGGLDSVLAGLPGVQTVTTRVYTAEYLSSGLQVPTSDGFYVHRDEHYPIASAGEAIRLSREAWVTWEPHWGVKVVGLFRELGDEDGIARLNRIAWYPSYDVWLATRNNDDEGSRERFRARRQYLIEGSGVAVATDRVMP